MITSQVTKQGGGPMTVTAFRMPGSRVLGEVDAAFRSLVDGGHAPGVCYGVVGREGLLHAAGHGAARVDGPAPDPATAFRIASMTKSFTAASVLLLAERGALGTADPVSRYVPEFGAVRPPTSDAPPVTVGMLLSMSGGLPTDDPWADRQEAMTPEEFGRLLTGGIRFVSTPGTAYEYSNLGYALLGRVVEAASGMPYRAFAERHLIAPLGLDATGFDTSVAAPGGIAAGHARLDGRWQEQPFSPPGVFSAIGGLFSTVQDLARWVRWLAGAFPARDGDDPGPLSRASRREMQQIHRVVPGDGVTGYGYGLKVEHDPDHGVVVSHSGGYPGHGSHMRWHPATGLGVISLTNARYTTGRTQAIAALRAVLADAAGPPPRPRLWPETEQARLAVERLLRDWDPRVAGAWFADNVAMDLDLGRRRARIRELVAAVGPLPDPAPPGEPLRSDSPAHAVWTVHGARGALRCEIRLNPQHPPRIQTLEVEPGEPGTG
jgi:CubicO group peptidase (beta-lactamase class C family)